MLFTLASSGFTTVIQSCAMASQCCMMSKENACPAMDLPAGASVVDAFRCLTTTIAGGPSTMQGFVQNDALPGGLSVHFVIPAGSDDIAVSRSVISPFSPLLDTSPPHPVEKYVLNQTFLI